LNLLAGGRLYRHNNRDGLHGGLGAGKACSVAGGDHDRELTGLRRSLGAANVLIPLSAMSFPPGRGLAKGKNDPVEKLVLEDGPERTISVWCEHVTKNAGGAGGRAGRGAVPVLLVKVKDVVSWIVMLGVGG
jgi:hypothetical protein